MNQRERREYLINKLLAEQPQYRELEMPVEAGEQKRLLRSLMNVRRPQPVSSDITSVQDEYLQTETCAKGITEFSDMTPVEEGIYLWKGDITTLRCDAIVNAANSGLTGCYYPCHGCIDNAIHTYAGMQLRLECARLIERQGHEEPVGSAKITAAYNLPCKCIIHTVGPIVGERVTSEDERLLESCYRFCLELAETHGIKSIAFCCISTGEFHFPNERAAEIAVKTVRDYMKRENSQINVIFNVFKEIDYDIYRKLLTGRG